MKKLKPFRLQHRIKTIQPLILIVILVAGCRSSQEIFVEYTDRGYYKNHVNSEQIRNQIKRSFNSIVRIQNNVIYRTYQFYLDDMPTASEVQGGNLEDMSAQSHLDDQSTAGTAIVVSSTRGKHALLTASHTVFYPDTIWHYNNGSDNEERMVEAVSIKQSINHFVLMENGIIRLELVANDSSRDLAIMSNSTRDEAVLVDPLSIPMGNSDRLDWGDMVYAVGYPKGAKMVTLGTVSLSDHPTRSIIIDASFNRGFSGGAIFTVRNDGSGLEWMGVVLSALGENETFLAPEVVDVGEFDPDQPYTGSLYVRSTPRINYGITNAVDINEIREFFMEYRNSLNSMGIYVP